MKFGLDLAFVGEWIRKYWLAVWFAIISAIRLSAYLPDGPGFDARLYIAATRAWLSGADPWVTINGTQFAAPPPSVLPFVPLAILPDPIGAVLLVGLGIAGVIATVRLLQLPWWWVLFPPFVDVMWIGNPQSLVVPLILAGAGPIATFVKLYSVVPIVMSMRWRALALTVVALVVTLPILPWASYIARFGELSATLDKGSIRGLSATAVPWLLPIAGIALIMCGRERAGWLAIPVVWPSTQWYYSTLAVPALTPVAAALMSVPIPGFVVLAAVAVAVERRNTSIQKLVADWWPAGRKDPGRMARATRWGRAARR